MNHKILIISRYENRDSSRFRTHWAAPVVVGCSLVQACPVFVTLSVILYVR